MVRIGFIGVGRMGLPMCVTLVRAGYQVTAGDVRAELESAVTGCGARWEGTLAALAAESDVLITMLPGAGAVTLNPGVPASLAGGTALVSVLGGGQALARA
jgi:3-hydroxyisobutyrate dehydrogenase-like beta-hydroxyacid dehydrogenase